MSTKEQGEWGEQLAQQHLLALGFRILERNYRCGREEIDIIARDGETLVFCEVKMRENDNFGAPEYALTPRKQQTIRKVASGYVFEHEIKEQECRFDVVAIRVVNGVPDIHYIRNAF